MKLGEFVGTRARFQRLKDSKLFNGWIDQMAGNRVVLGLTGSQVPSEGDEYRVEGYGHLVSVVFLAKLESISSDAARASSPFAISAETETEAVQPSHMRLNFLVSSAVRMVESQETVRYKLKNIAVQMVVDGALESGTAIDASFTGIGVRINKPVKQGDQTTMSVATPLGTVSVSAECRHCREDSENPGQFRAGFQFLEFGRVDKPKWERFITNLR